MTWADSSLWLIGIVLVTAMTGAHELGRFAYRRLSGAADASREDSSDEGFILSAVLGLLALLLAFAFSLALDRHQQHRALLTSEAGALSGFSDRLRLLDEPRQGALRSLLREYGEARLAAGSGDEAALSPERRRENILGERLKQETFAVARASESPATETLLVQGVEAVDDAAFHRRALAAAGMPGRVLSLLALYCIFSALMLGYVIAATGSRHRVAAVSLFTLLSFAFATILDLERPESGGIQVSEAVLKEVVEGMRR